MVLAYHLVFTAYGFWLPNDPRGSWSDFVRSWDLYLAGGPATKTSSHRSRAQVEHDFSDRLAAKSALAYEPVKFSMPQMESIARGFTTAIARSDFTLYACTILSTHIHTVVARHDYDIEKVMAQLKGEASKALARESLHPFQNVFLPSGKRHSPWADDGWDVYLNTHDDIHRAIRYVRNNPIKESLPEQNWPFVIPYRPV